MLSVSARKSIEVGDRDLAGRERAAPPQAQKRMSNAKRRPEGRRFEDEETMTREEECSVLGRPGSDLLSQGLSHSTIGAEEFDGRVRDGIGYGLLATTTRPAKDRQRSKLIVFWLFQPHARCTRTLKMRAIKPIERLVPVSCTHCCASTSGLSTWWSSTVLKGILVLRWVSRLDAFSGYPVRT
jgi:hypothetical protein